MEFKQRETKAAFMIINAMQEKLIQLNDYDELAQKKRKFKTSELKEQAEMFLTSHWMEVELLKGNIEQLQKDIENQSFDF